MLPLLIEWNGHHAQRTSGEMRMLPYRPHWIEIGQHVLEPCWRAFLQARGVQEGPEARRALRAIWEPQERAIQRAVQARMDPTLSRSQRMTIYEEERRCCEEQQRPMLGVLTGKKRKAPPPAQGAAWAGCLAVSPQAGAD